MSSFLITGASGLVGRNLIRKLLQEGHEVKALVRNPKGFYLLPKTHVYQWEHHHEPQPESLKNIDVVINLAGEGIADKRWSHKRKQTLLESRLMGTKNIVQAIKKIENPSEAPTVLISGSAMGIYGSRKDEELDERSLPGEGFLADLCQKWENEALKAQSKKLRVVLLRTGIVLSKEGGALSKMPPVVIGRGQDWMSWIHIDDMIRFILKAAEDIRFTGAYNLTSPHPIKNKDFIYIYAMAKKFPLKFSVPKTFLKLALGEMSTALTSSLRVYPRKSLEHGFEFRYSEIGKALTEIYKGDHFLDNYLIRNQFVPFLPEETFQFFSKAENLKELAPPWLILKIVNKSTPNIEKGTLIDYELKVRGLPIKWRTLISEWFPGKFFIDEQLKGPYKKWHHEHKFEKVYGGTIIRDKITYRVPYGLLGFLILRKWISKDVEAIFSYRQQKISNIVSDGHLSSVEMDLKAN